MTRKDYMKANHPDQLSNEDGGVSGCPHNYPDLCEVDHAASGTCPAILNRNFAPEQCEACWNTELPSPDTPNSTNGVIGKSILDTPTFHEKIPTRADVLREAEKIVCNDRNKQYGEPEDNFETIASLWNPYLSAQLGQDVHLDGADVGMLMTLFKVGRIMSGQAKRDNFVDAAGYIACAAGIALKEEQK